MQRKTSIGLVLAVAVVFGSQTTAMALSIDGANVIAGYLFQGNTKDSSGNGYNGTLNAGGTAAYTAGPGGRSAFSFNGSTNIATTSTDNLNLVSHSFSVDAWVNFSNPTGGDEPVFGTTTGGTNLGLHLQERNDAAMMGFYSDDINPSGPALIKDTWYNIAWVYDSTGNGTQELYVNGALVATHAGTVASPVVFLGTGETAYIGQDCCAGEQLTGSVSNLFVFNSALTQQQVQAASAAVPEPSTIALFGFGVAGLLVAARRRRRA